MIEHKKEFLFGCGLLIVFLTVLVIFFSPIFDGKNGLDYLDNLYNSISKGSAYYIPAVKKEINPLKGRPVYVRLVMGDEDQAEQTAQLFEVAGAEAVVSGVRVEVTGDLGEILENCLADADAMYHNDGGAVSAKYGYDEKQVLSEWWKGCKEMDKDLKRQKRFKEAEVVALLVNKAIEPAYNYYKIEPQKIVTRWGIVIFSLIFYVVYTLWYGFAIMLIFEGWGMKLEH